MPHPALPDPFLTRPAPRCLTRGGPREIVQMHAGRARWPLRAAFQAWAVRLLLDRSRDAS